VILTLAADCQSEPQGKNDQLFLLHDFPPKVIRKPMKILVLDGRMLRQP
jgi:hypothetical protein